MDPSEASSSLDCKPPAQYDSSAEWLDQEDDGKTVRVLLEEMEERKFILSLSA
jgi:hypothetical protein